MGIFTGSPLTGVINGTNQADIFSGEVTGSATAYGALNAQLNADNGNDTITLMGKASASGDATGIGYGAYKSTINAGNGDDTINISGIAPAQAGFIWNWSFSGETGASQTGTFTTTDGDINNPNTVYSVTDFSVTNSDAGIYPAGAPIGSISNGTYGPTFPAVGPGKFRFINNTYNFTSSSGQDVDVNVFSRPTTVGAYQFLFTRVPTSEHTPDAHANA